MAIAGRPGPPAPAPAPAIPGASAQARRACALFMSAAKARQFDRARLGPAAAHYDVRVKEGATMKAGDCRDYAQALGKLKRSRDAILWYKNCIARDPERDFSN